jgi:hypothetical protein
VIGIGPGFVTTINPFSIGFSKKAKNLALSGSVLLNVDYRGSRKVPPHGHASPQIKKKEQKKIK